MPEDTPVNIGVLLEAPHVAGKRVLGMQTKLHQWAAADPGRRFDDLYNLVYDPAFLVAAWERVADNTGARSAGIDKRTVAVIRDSQAGVAGFLEHLRHQLQAREFRPAPVKERFIPKPTGGKRRLGIPTVADRVVQAAVKQVLEPIFETDFQPFSYGFRPARRAHDAIAEIRYHARQGYEWILDADIAACFDEIDHTALLGLVRRRIKDKRVVELVQAFLKAGILNEDRIHRDTYTGTPQGGILSPLLANIALSELDNHFHREWERHHDGSARSRHRKRGGATYRLVRYADDFVVMVFGTREHTLAVSEQVSTVLARVGLRLAPDKTGIRHIDEGFDFLGFRIRRHRQWGSDRRLIYTYPSTTSMEKIKRKIKHLTQRITHKSAEDLFRELGSRLRGWARYFRHAASGKAFKKLQRFLWWRVWYWMRNKHRTRPQRWIINHYYTQWWPEDNGVKLYQPATMKIIRYTYRGKNIPTPWDTPQPA